MKLVPIPTPPSSSHPHTPLREAKATIIYTETDEAPVSQHSAQALSR